MEKLNPHQENKRQLLESLAVRVRATRELLSQATKLSALSSADAITAIDNLLNELPAGFPKGTDTRRTELTRLRTKFAELDDQIDLDQDSDSTEFSISDFEVYSRIETGLEKVCIQIEEIMEDPNVAYLETIEEGLMDLQSKALFLEYVKSREQSNNPDIIHTETDAFSFVSIVQESAWTRKNSNGYFLPDTPNIFIRESVFNDVNQYPITLAHERVHNILDGIKTHTVVNPVVRISNKLDLIKNLIRLKAPEVILEHEIAKLSSRRYLDYLLDCTHNELLAYWDSHENTALDSITLYEILLALTNGLDELSDMKISMLATAGVQLRKAVALLAQLPAELSKLGYKKEADQIENLHEHFQHMIVTMISLTRGQSHKATVLGPEAEADRRALMYLLPPTKWRHIDSYLDSVYGVISSSTDEEN